MNLSINKYRNTLQNIIDYGGSINETTIRRCFIDLVNDFAEDKNLKLIEELEYRTPQGTTVYPDGTLKDRFRLSCGYYEAKDPKDDLDKEIEDKTRKYYPLINTIFENSVTAVLYQNNFEYMRIDMSDDEQLEKILNAFIDFERQEIYQFHAAIEQFKVDLPNLVIWCREEIETAKSKSQFQQKTTDFLEQCQREINPDFSFEDIREILIQHMLTNKLSIAVFNEAEFHKANNIALSIDAIVDTFFTREKKKEFEDKNKHFYNTISIAASQIMDHHEKQDFLKTLYEEFYKTYNPKEADRLGVVYMPSQIVDFMVRTTDDLLAKHFNTGLAENNVKIIDPATGTGTFITALIDRIPPAKLKHKYLNDLFANEVGILPYYVSNLNIEYTYWQKMDAYLEFPNICYTDTLDNSYYTVDTHGQSELTNLLTEENAKRLQNQNESKISVVIGNPPYNANQKNYNNQNANRPYPKIDRRIRETFTKESRAQKKKYEDMYLRFYRWAMDRLDNKNVGIVAFVSNRSFVDAINIDGFRAVIGKEFDYLYILDTQSDVRKNPKISGTKNNMFGIQTGVALMFAVKCPHDPQAKPVVHYYTMRDEDTREEKLQFLKHNAINTIPWTRIYPDQHSNWLNISATDYDTLLPLVADNGTGVFYQCFPGVSTNRNDWVYDFSPKSLSKKVKYFIRTYNKSVAENKIDISIKWSRDLFNNLKRGLREKYIGDKIIDTMFRPYVKKYYYASHVLSDSFFSKHIDCLSLDNCYIAYSGRGHNHVFSTLASKYMPNLDTIEKGQCLPLYIKNQSSRQISNVTDWALTTFTKHYRDKTITKEDVFHYVYAVFHNPGYKEKYKDDLRREHPAIPLYKNFKKWAAWGKSLMDIHVNYEAAEEYPVKISVGKNENIKNEFKFDKKSNRIIIDDAAITGIPPEAL
jgi:predicted helicase